MKLIMIFIFCANMLYSAPMQLFKFPKGFQQDEEFMLIQQLKKSCIKEFERNKKIKCVGSGGGGTEQNKHIHSFFLSYYEEKTPNQAREIIIPLLEKAVTIFNECEEYKKFCKGAPYTSKNFRIYLSFFKPNGQSLASDQFSDCCAIEGILRYLKDANPQSGFIFQETFEEAKIKLQLKE